MIFTESLKNNRDFQVVYKNGKSFANKYLVMYVLENGTGCNRLGISVSKKVGNSVVRHRVKRLIKESYRLHEGIFNSGFGGEVGGKVEFYNSDKKYGVDLPASGINFSVFAGLGSASPDKYEINKSDSYNIRTFSGSGPSLLDYKVGLGHTVFEGRFTNYKEKSPEDDSRLFSSIGSVYGSFKIGDENLRLVYGNDNILFGNRLDANETANLSLFYKIQDVELEFGFFNVTDQVQHVQSESELNPDLKKMTKDPAGFRSAGGKVWDENRKLATYDVYGKGIKQHVIFLGIQNENIYGQLGVSGKTSHNLTQGAIHNILGYHLFPHKSKNYFHFEFIERKSFEKIEPK